MMVWKLLTSAKAHVLQPHVQRVSPAFRPSSNSYVRRGVERAAASPSSRIDTTPTAFTASPVTPHTPNEATQEGAFSVVNFYHLSPVAHPGQTAKDHKDFIKENGWNIRGRIYIAFQGINAQFSGPTDEALAYTEWIAAQPEFEGMTWRSYSVSRNMFPKLKLKFRPNLISLKGGMADLPVTDPSARATALQPSAWKEMLLNATKVDVDSLTPAKKPVLLDVRNSYEWDAGHFSGAARPLEDEFCETPRGDAGEDSESSNGGNTGIPAYLQDVDPTTPIMMYCTGGIRCDIYSTFLKQKGFQNLYSLEGGIQNYLEEEGPTKWNGSLYVFDDRMAVAAGNMSGDYTAQLPAAVGCQLCGSQVHLPHLNCANVDCNFLFLACSECKVNLKGCCCEQCRDNAPRMLRPMKDGAPYRGMTNYTSGAGAMKKLRSPEQLAKIDASRERRRSRLRAANETRKAEKLAVKKLARLNMQEKQVQMQQVETQQAEIQR